MGVNARRAALPVVAASILLGASAPAATLRGTARADVLRGTPGADAIDGRGGNDRLLGRAGGDYLEPGAGRDRVLAGRGADRVQAQDGRADRVLCGRGVDVVTADAGDRVGRDCEVVSRRISRDPYRRDGAQHETEVEPDTFAFGSTVVTAFQAGRFSTGGASNIGFATSRDAGKSWRSGFLPNLTVVSRPRGGAGRATDPSVAYDAVHRVWLIASLALNLPQSTVVVSRSPDGVNWSPPVVVAAAPGRRSLAFDKEWIVCDNSPASRFRGNCYVSYGDFVQNRLSTQTSRDGGLTWSPAVGSPDRAQGVGAQPVVRANGDLVVTYLSERGIEAIRSTNGGASFSRRIDVARVFAHPPTAMRAPPLPSSEVDGSGTVYVVWQDCRFRRACSGNDIVYSSSSDAVTWSPPRRIPGAGGTRGDHFIPGLAVDPARPRRPSRPRLAVAYYYFSEAACQPAACRLHVGFTASSDGTSWRPPRRLSAQPMRLSWIPRARGRMVGDYISTSFAGSRAVPVFAVALPGGARFRQAMFATSIPVPATPG